MASNLRVDNIQPSVGMGIGIGTANGSVTFNADVTGGMNIATGLVGVGTDNPDHALHLYSGNLGIGKSENTGFEITIGDNNLSFSRDAKSFINQKGTGTISVRLGSSNTEVAEFTSDGLKLPSGKGIDFSATGGPGDGTDTSELLNDYEEGTFTPLFGASTTNPTYTASLADGFYTKIGNQVTCWGIIIVTGTPTNGSGNWFVTSLPYSAATGTSYTQNGIIGYQDVLTNEVNKLYIAPGASYCQIIPNGVTQSNETYNNNAITSGYFSFTITYRI